MSHRLLTNTSSLKIAAAYWGPSLPVGPACWTMGTEKSKLCTIGKKIFCTGLTRAAKAYQKSLVPARQPQRTNQGGIPFICIP
jgi:hypothetical protein